MYTVYDMENHSAINNVMLDEVEQNLVTRLHKEFEKGNEQFKGVYLLSQAIHRGFEASYRVDGWRLMFLEPSLVCIDEDEDEYEEFDEWEWWLPSDVSILLAYAYLSGDESWLHSYPGDGWYSPLKTIRQMEDAGFGFNICPQLEDKYSEYANDEPTYMGTRYFKTVA